jgi:signal transduction histidine kinase
LALGRVIPIRLRLTLCFALIGALVLAAGGTVMYYRLHQELDRGLNASLRTRTTDVALLERTRGAAASIARLPASDEAVAQVLDARGRVLDATSSLSGASVLSSAQRARALRGAVVVDYPVVRGTDENLRLLAQTARIGGHTRIVVVGASLEGRDQALASLRQEFLIGLPLAVLAAALGAFALASAVLRPVRALRRGAQAITRTGPVARLPEPATRDEIGALARTLNEMLARLEAASERERRFVADASHELRGPLTLVQSELEVTLGGPRDPARYRGALQQAEREVAGLVQLTNDLLLIARADENRLPLKPEEVEPRTIVDSLARRFARRARADDRALTTECAGEGVIVVDRLRVEQALANLVENALRHGRGSVALSTRRSPGSIEFAVRDDGAGMPSSFVPHAFERFTRADPARSGPGAGLGLAIVELIAHAHGGDTHVEQDGSYCEVRLRLPT